MNEIYDAFDLLSDVDFVEHEHKNPKITKISAVDSKNVKVGNDDLLLAFVSMLTSNPNDSRKISLTQHNIQSMNILYKEGISEIFTEGFRADKNYTKIYNSDIYERINLVVEFSNVNIQRPMTSHGIHGPQPAYPTKILTEGKTYRGNLYATMHIKLTAYKSDGSAPVERTAVVAEKQITRIPIMVGTELCNTYNKTKDELIAYGEDPTNHGGNFVIKSNEWVIDTSENIAFNQPRIYRNEGHKGEVARCEFLSKPGDSYQNSGRIIIKIMSNHGIQIEIQRAQFGKLDIPFYLLFRALGVNNDTHIIEHIIHKSPNDTEVSDAVMSMMNKLHGAFNAKYKHYPDGRSLYDTDKVYEYMCNIINEAVPTNYYGGLLNQNNMLDAIAKLRTYLNTFLLPHIGLDDSSMHDKARFLGDLIHKTLLVEMRSVYPETDRDSYTTKRCHDPGRSLGKVIKSAIGKTLINKLYEQYGDLLASGDFNKIQITEPVDNYDGQVFEQMLIQAITTGNKSKISVGGGQVHTNYLSSQRLQRKTYVNALAMYRQIIARATDNTRMSERAKQMRQVHPTYLGYVCLVHTPEGASVGLNKQLAMFAVLTQSGVSEVIKQRIHEEKEFIPLKEVKSTEVGAVNNMGSVYVNGDWIGVVESGIDFAKKLRQKRRDSNSYIDMYTTIHWSDVMDEVNIWVDHGRIVRPLFIVYNSYDNPEMFDKSVLADGKKNGFDGFVQGIAFTPEHARLIKEEKIDLFDLVEAKIIEFISAEEQTNCLVCPTVEELTKTCYDATLAYTHCDVPQSMLGITALSAPYGNKNQGNRMSFQCFQFKSTCGYYADNWDKRTDKESFLQYLCEDPLLTTISNQFAIAGGMHSMVAIAAIGGYNQEDSIMANQTSIDRGFYNGCKMTYEKVILDEPDKELFGELNRAITRGTKQANYERLTKDGHMKTGDIINKGDVYIGKFQEQIDKNTEEKYLMDMSSVWKSEESAVIHNVLRGTDSDCKPFIKISFRKIRPLTIGDKMSSRSAQKGVIGMKYHSAQLPFTETGMVPTLVINPHAIPTRMTMAQLVESTNTLVCAEEGRFEDGTIFRNDDVDAIENRLSELGYKNRGYFKLFHGKTGEYIDAKIYMGLTLYQRLMKFSVEQIHTVDFGPIDSRTRQPIQGKAHSGGLRIGEMEVWVMNAHGCAKFMQEKLYNHCDGCYIYVCQSCGNQVFVNHRTHDFVCKFCESNANIYEVPAAWYTNLLLQQYSAMNIGVKLIIEPSSYDDYTSFRNGETDQMQIKSIKPVKK